MKWREEQPETAAETEIIMIKGDITEDHGVQAIVNAANTSLLGGGGVDGAIHRAAGPQLLSECRMLNGCRTGKAKITKAYQLPCEYIIHTPGPHWNGGRSREHELLASCYQSCLELAAENGIRSIAFPSISTGIYSFPVDQAARIAIGTAKKFIADNPGKLEVIKWVLFDEKTLEIYKTELAQQRAFQGPAAPARSALCQPMINSTIRNRRSIRKFKNTDISEKDIEKIIEAASLAPSGKNKQPWKFLVYAGEKKGELLAQMEKGIQREIRGDSLLPASANGLPDAKNTLRIMQEAPVVIIVFNPEGKSPFEMLTADERFTEIIDTLSIGAAIENMLLQAEELGIGTLWIGNTCFAYSELTDYIGLSGQLAGAVALGTADENPPPRPRKKMEEIVEYRI